MSRDSPDMEDDSMETETISDAEHMAQIELTD